MSPPRPSTAANDAGTRAGRRRADAARDPGYYLLAGGRRAFEAAIGFRPSLRAWPGRSEPGARHRRLRRRRRRYCRGAPRLPLFVLHASGLGPAWLSVLGVLGAIPAIDVAVALVNRGVTRGFGATPAARSGTARRGARSICARWSPCRHC